MGLADNKQLGYTAMVAVNGRAKDIIDPRRYGFTAEGATVPGGLTAVGTSGIDCMARSISDVDQGVASKTFDRYQTIVARAHGIGEGIELFLRLAVGISGC